MTQEDQNQQTPLLQSTSKPLLTFQKLDQSDLSYHNRLFCQHVIESKPYWAKHRECRRQALYHTNGFRLCQLHAGQMALHALTENSPVTSETSDAEKI